MKLKLITFPAVAMLLVNSSVVFAETTTLICDTGPYYRGIPATVDLDETQGTVTIHMPPLSTPGGGGGPERTEGPNPAKFDPDTITSKNKYGDIFTINRLTGVLMPLAWTCHAGKKQF